MNTAVKGLMFVSNNGTVGERIRSVRAERKMTLVAFAEALGISHSHLSQVENDKAQPSRQLLLAIERVFKVRLGWLETGEGPRQADVTKLMKELLAPYPKDVQMMAWVEFAKAEAHDVLMDAVMKLSSHQVEDPRFQLILNFLKDRWDQADSRQRVLIEVRLARLFPEFEDYIQSAGAAGEPGDG